MSEQVNRRNFYDRRHRTTTSRARIEHSRKCILTPAISNSGPEIRPLNLGEQGWLMRVQCWVDFEKILDGRGLELLRLGYQFHLHNSL